MSAGVAAGDTRAVIEASHALKSLSYNIGATAVAGAAPSDRADGLFDEIDERAGGGNADSVGAFRTVLEVDIEDLLA